MSVQTVSGDEIDTANGFPRSALANPGTTGSASANTSIVSLSYTFRPGYNYLIIANGQQLTPATSGSVWEVDARVNGNNVGQIRQENGGGAGQRGATIVGYYSTATTVTYTVDLFIQRLTGTANMVWELPYIMVIPVL